MYTARHNATDILTMVKLISIERLNRRQKAFKKLQSNEIHTEEKVDHPNIQKVLQILQDSDNFYII